MAAEQQKERESAGIPVEAARRISRFAWGVVLLALIVRAAALWASADAALVKDENAYVRRATALLDGEGYVGSYQSWVRHTSAYKIAELPQYPGAYQPPGYTTFVAAALAVSGRNPLAVKAAQVLLGTGAVLLVYLLGRAWYGERTGRIAAVLAALYPNLVAFTHLLWSETLFILLFLGLLYSLTRAPDLPSRSGCVLAGVLLGLTALTRSSIVYFLPALLAWMLWMHRMDLREALLRCLVIVAVAGAVIAPWSVRNYAIHDGFVLIDTNGPYNLWRGNHITSYEGRYEEVTVHYEWPFDTIPVHPVSRQVAPLLVNAAIVMGKNMTPTDLEITRYASQQAWSNIFADPLLFVKRIRYRMIDMWNPTSFMIRHFQLKAYGEDVPRSVELFFTWIAVISYLLVLPLGIVGLALSLRDPRSWLVVLLIGFFTAISMLAFGLTRFRIPLMPLFILGAGYAVHRAMERFSAVERVPDTGVEQSA